MDNAGAIGWGGLALSLILVGVAVGLSLWQGLRRRYMGLALAFLLYTGARRSDVVQLGRQHIRDSWLTFRVFKNRLRKHVEIQIPVLPELQAIIDATPEKGVIIVEYWWQPPNRLNGGKVSFTREELIDLLSQAAKLG